MAITISGQTPSNAYIHRHYAEIMKQVEAGTLTIQETDNE